MSELILYPILNAHWQLKVHKGYLLDVISYELLRIGQSSGVIGLYGFLYKYNIPLSIVVVCHCQMRDNQCLNHEIQKLFEHVF